MGILKRGENIGRILAGRVRDFPTFLKQPKKKPARWAVFPDFRVRVPKRIDREEGERDYPYDVSISSADRCEIYSMLDHAISIGTAEMETDRAIFWLHAVRHSVRRVRGENLFQANLTYILRVKPVPEQIPS